MATDTTTTTIEILDPIGTEVEPTGSRPLEDGLTPLIQGQQYLDITFSDPHTDYNIDELHVENTVDNPPLLFPSPMVVYRDENGFRVLFNSSPDSEFYLLRWRITI